MVWVSARRGTRVSTYSPGASSVAAMSGSAAFFAPETSTVPDSGRPPWMTRLSIGCLSVAVAAWVIASVPVPERRV